MRLFKDIERGQGMGEYALIISFASIAALAIVTVLVNPQDWRDGVIYKGIYRPVQCAVQGISRENCQDASNFSAVRYPSVEDGNTRKLCSDGTYISGSNPWATCSTGASPSTPAVEPPVLEDIVIFSDLSGAQTPGRLSNNATYEADLYDFGVLFTNDSPEATSVEFDIEKQTGTDTNGDPIFADYSQGGVSGRTDNDVEFLLNERNGIELVADGSDPDNPDHVASYKLTVTPSRTENVNGSDVIAIGNAISIIFQVEPSSAEQINITSISFVNPGSGDNEREIQPPSVTTYYEGSYAIKVDVTGEAHRLTFNMNGPVAFSTNLTQQSTTYYPFGATNGVLDGQTLTAGTYTLAINAYDADDNQADSVTNFQFQVEAVPTDFSVTSFEYVDANNDQTIDTLSDGDTLVLTDQDSVNFVAIVNNGNTSNMIESVSLTLNEVNGALNVSQAENQIPYAVFGDNNGNFNGQVLAPGDYLLAATPYDGRDGGGNAGPTSSVSFTVERPPEEQGPIVSAFNMMNRDTGSQVRTMTDGEEFELPGFNWNIRTEVTDQGNGIDFVNYTLSGDATHTAQERVHTYDFPCSVGSDCNLNLQPGSYALEVIAYDLNGEAGPTGLLNFTVLPPPYNCTDTRAFLESAKCGLGGYYMNIQVTTYCDGNAGFDVTSPSDASPTNFSDWDRGGNKHTHFLEWSNNATNPNTNSGYYWPVCNEGTWDPITLEIDFGNTVNTYDINLSDYPGDDNDPNIELTPN